MGRALPPALLQTEFVYEAVVEIAAPVEVGPTPQGTRRYIPITGGSFEGPKILHRILPGGADWQTSRPIGATELDALYSIRADDGTVIIVRNTGIAAGSYLRTAPRFVAPPDCTPGTERISVRRPVAGGPRPVL